MPRKSELAIAIALDCITSHVCVCSHEAFAHSHLKSSLQEHIVTPYKCAYCQPHTDQKPKLMPNELFENVPQSVCPLQPGTAQTLPLSQDSSLKANAAAGRFQLCKAVSAAAVLRAADTAGGCPGRGMRVQPRERPQGRVRLTRRIHRRGRHALRSRAQRQ